MEEQVSHISDLEGLNSELEGFLADLHGREESISARVKTLEEELAAARSSAAAAMDRMTQREGSLTSALEQLRASLLKESSKSVTLTSERDELSRRIEAAARQLEEAKTALAQKEALLKDTREAAKSKAEELSAAIKEAGASLLNESSKASALAAEREKLARQLETVSARLEDFKQSAAEKEELLKAARAAAKEESAKFTEAIEAVRGSLLTESSRVAVLAAERDGLLRQVEEISGRLKEAKAIAAEKDALIQEARAEAKEKSAAQSAALEQLRVSQEGQAAKAAALTSEHDGLLARLKEASALLEEEKAASSKKDALLNETRAAAKARSAELSAVIDQLKAALFEESLKVETMVSERNGLLRQLEESAALLEGEKAASAKKDALLNEARAAAKAKAAELSAAVDRVKASLLEENSRAEALLLERDGLLRKLEMEARSLEAEKSRSAERELLINGARSAIKDKEAEIEKVLRSAEELRTELTLERANVKDREAQLQKAIRFTEGVERRLEQAAQENSRTEEGFLLKMELVKKELREQTKRTGEIERKLAAAGARLEDSLDEVGKKEKMLAEANAALAEKDAQLKDANLKLKELTREFSEVKSGSGHENVQRARDMAASMAARVEELENAMSEAAARSLEKFRASQAELSASKAALRVKEEENAGLKSREGSLIGELSDAEEKWKLASAQLHNAVSRLRNAENENEIALGRLKSVEEERNKFRAAAIKAETASAAMAAQESRARDGEASGLMAALEEQAAMYTALLRKYDDIVLLNETLAREKAGDKAEADSLRAALKAAQDSAEADSGEKRGRQSGLAEKLRGAEALLKKKEDALEEACAIAKAAGDEAVMLRARLRETAATAAAAATEAETERSRYAALSEKMRSADSLLKKKETEIEEARAAVKSAQEAAEAATGEKRGVQSGLTEKLRGAEALLKKKEFELEEARAAAASASDEAVLLRAHLQETAASAAGEAVAERARYAALSEKMHNADALLRKKEFELDEARGALFALENECSLLRASRAALGEKYSREIHAENELLKEAQARIVERDSFIARLSLAEEELKKEAEALKKEKQNLLSLVRKKSAASTHSVKVSEAERLLAEKESRLMKLRSELDNTRAEKAELQGREKELREELKSRPYRAMLREAEENLLIKEKMLAEVTSRMQKIGKDFEDLKDRGQTAGAPGYVPDFEELVAGVAHQVANSISIIRSHAEFCAETPEAEGAKESLNVIVRNIVNLQKKIDIIMNFSKPVIPQRSPERLATVLSEVINVLRSSGRLENIRVSLSGGEKLRPVSLDRVRFASAVEQLLLNAAEAMPEGGELSVSLSGGQGRQRLEVADTGPGVEKKNLSAVFHPFFTTKPGKMGLGLTLARNVARAHGGTLELLNGPDKGARAVLEVPEA